MNLAQAHDLAAFVVVTTFVTDTAKARVTRQSQRLTNLARSWRDAMATGDNTVDLYPYLLRGTWVFDDPRTGLKEEAFVCGASEMISRLLDAKGIANAESGFRLSFSAHAFDEHDVCLTWLRGDRHTGNWYSGEIAGGRMEGWLCPALYHYFHEAPPRIYVQAGRLPAGVNPIWNPPTGVTVRRFVEAPAQPGHGGENRQ